MKRFFVRAGVGSGASVLDADYFDRVVAVCPEMGEALIIASFLEGEIEVAQKLHDVFLLHFPSNVVRSK